MTTSVKGEDTDSLTFSVTVTTAGEFSTTYNDSALQARTETKLKISGPLNGTDIQRIKNAMTVNFTELNLSNAKIVGEGSYVFGGRHYAMREDTLASHIFSGINKLQYIYLPSSLKAIEDNALAGCSNLSKIEIPSSVFSIGNSAFYSCSLADGITLNEGLLNIGNSAFSNTKLTSFVLPQSVISIGKNCFHNSKQLTSVTFNNNITKLEDELFENCDALESFDIPSTITVIGNRCFYGCKKMTSFKLPEGLRIIGSYAFYNTTGIADIVFPETVDSIGDYALQNSTIQSVTLPKNISTLPKYLFSNCKNLTHVDIPKSVKNLPKGLFYNCTALKSITFSNDITYIPDNFVNRCSELQTFDIPATVKRIGSNAFSYCSQLTAIDLKEGLTYIGEYAFNQCTNLTTVELPSTVDSICKNAFYNNTYISLSFPERLQYIGDHAFYNCKNLSFETLPGTLKNIGQYAFYGCNSQKIILPPLLTTLSNYVFSNCISLEKVEFTSQLSEIGTGAFQGCKNLTEIKIPSSCHKIGNYAFQNCANISYIEIPEGVTNLPNAVFQNCTNMDSVSLPSTLKSIGNNSFDNCSSLCSISLPEAISSIGQQAFYKCSNLKKLAFPKDVVSIGSEAMKECETLEEVVLPQNMTSLPTSLFYNCKAIKQIIIPDSVKTLPTSLFSGCTSLQTVQMSDEITKIPSYFFHNCSSLTNFVLPKNIESIDNNAFQGCSSLQNILLPESVTSIGQSAFANCSQFTEIALPENVTELSNSLFSGCSNLITVTTSNKLTKIGNYVFSDCSSLKDFIIPSTVTSIGSYAFRNTKKLKNIIIPEGITELPYTFNGSGLVNINLPSTITKLECSFSNCDSLTSFTVNEGCTEIYETWTGCNNLKLLYLPSTITKVGKYTFTGSTPLNLQEVHIKATELPSCDNSLTSKAILYVPQGCSELYENHSYWSRWTNILEEEYTLANINDDEWNVLQKIPLTTNGDEWKNKWTLNETKSESATPYGVTVSNGKVISLNLSGNNLRGNLPAEVFALPYLQTLILSDNNLNGDIKTICNNVLQKNDSITYIDISNNYLTGNLYNLTEIAPNITTLKANHNRISDIMPILPATITTLEFKGQDLRDYFTINYSELVALKGDPSIVLPSVLTYYNNSTDEDYYRTTTSFYMIDEGNDDNIKTWLTYLSWDSRENYKSNAFGYNNSAYDGWYMQPSGKTVTAYGSLDSDKTLRHCFNIILDYEMGDVNFDTEFNIADMQKTLNYALDSTYYNRREAFNFYAANIIDSDNTINVQDVVANIDLLLSKGVTPALSRKKIKSSHITESPTEQPEAKLYIKDGKLMLETSRPVAAMDITMSSNNTKWLPTIDMFLKANKNSRSIFYSLSGEKIPTGTTVLAYTDCNIVDVMLVDTDGEEISSAIDNNGLTSINNTLINNNEQLPTIVYDMFGRRINLTKEEIKTLSPGIYIINGEKVIVK